MRDAILSLFFLGTFACGAAEAPEPFQGYGGGRGAAARDESELETSFEESSPGEVTPHDGLPSTEPTDTSGVILTLPTAPGGGNSSWSGRVDRTAAVPFGGGKWCNYEVALSNIVVHVTSDAEGRIVATKIENTMTESGAGCDTLGVQQNVYAWNAPKSGPTRSLVIVHEPDPKNLPQARVTLRLEASDGDRARGRLEFQRIGGVEPALDWKVTTNVELVMDGVEAPR